VDFPILVVAVLTIAGTTCWFAARSGRYAACAVVGSAAILILHSRVFFNYQSDDAYISFRYARNLADGAGPVWNHGERVEGYTNFLWMGLLAAIRKLGVDTPFAARWLGFALSAAAAGSTYLLCQKMLPEASGRIAGVMAALLLAASGTWAVWAMAGLEGPLFATLLLWAILLHLNERESPRLPASGLLWALLAMTRPDGVVLFAITGAFKFGDGLMTAGRLDAQDNSLNRREALRLGLWIAMFAALYVPYFVWRFSYYGWFFPNTFYTKVGSGIEQYDRGLQYVAGFSREYGAALLLLVPAAVAFTSIRRAPVFYVGALMMGWVAYVIYIGGDALLRFRFLEPVLPLFYALVVTSAAALFDALQPALAPRPAVRNATIALIGGCFIAFTLNPSADGRDVLTLKQLPALLDQEREIGSWLNKEMPDTTLVAVTAAGTVPYVSQLPALDMLGLNDEHIAHRSFPAVRFGAGHEKSDSDYVLQRKPEIIILYEGLTATPLQARQYQYAQLSAVLIPAIVELAASGRLLAEYEPRGTQLPDGLWFNLLVRKDAADVMSKTVAAPP
jgi:arabinofuranosyltransferase